MEIDADQLMLINSKKAKEQADREAAAAAAVASQQQQPQSISSVNSHSVAPSLQTPPVGQPSSVSVRSVGYPMHMSQPMSCMTQSPYLSAHHTTTHQVRCIPCMIKLWIFSYIIMLQTLQKCLNQKSL